jgi:hypothetical protein
MHASCGTLVGLEDPGEAAATTHQMIHPVFGVINVLLVSVVHQWLICNHARRHGTQSFLWAALT